MMKWLGKAAKMEIIRRYYASLCDYKKGIGNGETVETIKKLMIILELQFMIEKL